MNARQGKVYLKNLKAAQDSFEREVFLLAENIRLQVIIPLCQKYTLKFYSGNGRFFFTDKNGIDYSDPFDPPPPRQYRGSLAIYNATKPILFLLNEEVSHNQVLGYYVSDAP